MIGYDSFCEFAPPALDNSSRDEWFRDRGYDPDDLIRVGQEVAAFRLADLAEGDRISAEQLTLAMVLAFAFGFELAVRCEREEKPDVAVDPNLNGNGSG